MTDQLTRQQVAHLVKLGADQFTGGDVAAFLRLAAGNDPAAADALALMTREKGPTVADLEEIADKGGFLGNFVDLRQGDDKLSPKQAFFVAWYGADERIRQPKTLADVAKLLHISRTRLYAWQAADWFDTTGIQRWERRFMTDHIPALYRKAYQNAMGDNGQVSNQAIKLLFEVRERQLGQAGPAVQVNVQNNQQVNIDEYRDNPLDLLRGRLNSLAAAERARVGAGGDNG